LRENRRHVGELLVLPRRDFLYKGRDGRIGAAPAFQQRLNGPKESEMFLNTSDPDQFVPQFVVAKFDDEALEIVKTMSSKLGSDERYCACPDVGVFNSKRYEAIP
jgi:hypothetical protein